MTMLAPNWIGFNKYGDGTVLSTIKGTLKALAAAEIFFKSSTSNFGFPKVSAKNTLVFSLAAAVKFSGFDGSTKVVVIPNRGKVTFNKL